MLLSDIRGQSETVGTILLIGLVLIAVTISGAIILSNYLNQEAVNEPLVDLEIESEDGDNINVQHMGGESIDTETMEVIVNNSVIGSFADANSFDGDQDGRFVTGESVTFASGISEGTIEVLVVDQETNTVVERDEITITSIFDLTNGDDVVEEINSLENLNEGKCGDEKNSCEENELDIQEDVDGFAYVESTEDAEVEIEEGDLGGAMVVNAKKEAQAEIEDGTVGGDVYMRTHDDEGEVEIEDSTVEGDIKIDADGEVEVETEGSTIEGDINESADVDLGLEEP